MLQNISLSNKKEMRLIITTGFITIFCINLISTFAQIQVRSTGDADMYKKGYDIPVGISHGTWDFDEWPGIDHAVVYKRNFMYNTVPNEKIKIDYFLSIFDSDDHEGYLKDPEVLQGRGVVDLAKSFSFNDGSKHSVLGIFAHPDDELLLAGGTLSYASDHGWSVKVCLLSNGADGSSGQSDAPSLKLGAYNCFGVLPDGKIVVKTDHAAENKLDIIQQYSKTLGISIEVLSVDLEIDNKKVIQIGEMPGIDFERTFGKSSPYREAIRKRLQELIQTEKPTMIFTHGTNGEYGNYIHKMLNEMVRTFDQGTLGNGKIFSCFPEYNISDHITHYMDLYSNKKKYIQVKWDTFMAIPFLYKAGNDFDKPWEPMDKFVDGVFVKDYGYNPVTAEPPRYEYFQQIVLE